MIRHCVLLTFTADTDIGHAAFVADELAGLPAEIPEIRAYAVGPDLGLLPTNSTLAVVADFDDQAGYFAYRDHPAHRAIIDALVTPHLASRAAVQFEI
jgi:hypothetical protein